MGRTIQDRMQTFGGLDLFGLLNFSGNSPEITISGGSVTPTGSYHNIDTQSDASSDDLDTIVGTAAIKSALLILRAQNATRTTVVKHGTGNIILAGGADFNLDGTFDLIMFEFDGTNWIEITRSNNGGF